MSDTRIVPILEIVGALESHISHREPDKAEEFILGKLEEYKNTPDYMGKLALLNEALVLYTQVDNKEEALKIADEAIKMLNDPMLDTRKGQITITTNAAKIYRIYGERDKALFLYVKSAESYEKSFQPTDPRLANMYNNIAMNISLLGEYQAAMELYDKAVNILQAKQENSAELALTHLNVAYMLKMKDEEENREEIEKRIRLGRELITAYPIETNYYVTLCESCANLFSMLGRTDYQKELLRQADLIVATIKRKQK